MRPRLEPRIRCTTPSRRVHPLCRGVTLLRAIGYRRGRRSSSPRWRVPLSRLARNLVPTPTGTRSTTPPMAPTFRGSPGDDVTRTGAGSCRASWELGATIPSALEARISAMWRATWTRHLPQPAAWDRRGAPSARYWRGGWREFRSSALWRRAAGDLRSVGRRQTPPPAAALNSAGPAPGGAPEHFSCYRGCLRVPWHPYRKPAAARPNPAGLRGC